MIEPKIPRERSPMLHADDPITARYLWNAEVMVEALSAHTDRPVTPLMKWASLVLGVVGVGLTCVMMDLALMNPALPRSDVRDIIILLFILVAVAGLVLKVSLALMRRKPLRRWLARRSFRHVPGGQDFVEWSIHAEQLCIRTETTATTFLWEAFLRIAETREGFLLYLTRNYFKFIPARAFRSVTDMARFSTLARSRATIYSRVAECRFVGKSKSLVQDEV